MPDNNTIETVTRYKKYSQSRRMGLSLNSPRVYNINHKLTLKDPYCIKIGSESFTRSIQKWIEQDPKLVWCILYRSYKFYYIDVEIVRPMSLASDAYRHLKRIIEKQNPELIRQLEQKKNRKLQPCKR